MKYAIEYMQYFLPPAKEVCEGYVFTGVCLSTGGWQGSMHGGGWGACMAWGCVAMGHGMCGKGGMHGWQGVCVVGGGHGTHVPPGRYYEI